jgi:hypothetical protein
MPELIEAFPPSLMLEVGYFGAADGAAAAFRRLASGLDVAIVRVVPSGPGLDPIRAVMRACRPELVRSPAAAGREPARGATGRPPSDPTRTRTG